MLWISAASFFKIKSKRWFISWQCTQKCVARAKTGLRYLFLKSLVLFIVDVQE